MILNQFRRPRIAATLVGLLLPSGCVSDRGEPPLFRLLPPSHTGVTFANTITTDDSVNVQTDVFIYNGAGVAAGDIDNDGLPDLFFTGNMVSSRLYLNKGDMRFEDITESAGLLTDRWASGASMVDVDNDGFLDIYVSVSGPEWTPGRDRANLLFLNNGDRTFTEVADAYQIADTGFTTHAAFLDYDRDGDLDLFLLGNSPEDFVRGEAERHPTGVRSRSTASYDRLYRNNADGTFTNVSRQAGILAAVGYGLGVVVTDINGDDWPDIYVSNDDTPSDVLYVNNRDGTFTDKAAQWLKHTSFAGMGMDIADFNNDGRPDILQTDMMPEELRGRKRMVSGARTYSGFADLRQRGFGYDYDINTLQLHGGVASDGRVYFSEIARMAGVAHTHWSWSALFGDYDNDGFKDIFITNGYPKAVTDFDYQAKIYTERTAAERQHSEQRRRAILKDLHSYEIPNYLFRNHGDLTFTDETDAWGMNQPSYSYGAAHVDLNNDGRLDVVVSNIDAPAFIYENVRPRDETNHYLQVKLQGAHPNVGGIGAKLILSAAGQKQYIYHTPYRGYVSSMDPRVHFGVGDAVRVDSLEVIWPDGRYQVLTDLQVDRAITVKQEEAVRDVSGVGCHMLDCPPRHPTPDTRHRLFQPVHPDSGVAYLHREKSLVDYSIQTLLPHMLSRQGPPLAVGDATGDGLPDVFIGGAAGYPGRLFVQQAGGGFTESTHAQPWVADNDHDDWGALFFDADGDGLEDLYVASGGYHFSPVSESLQDRLYINQGGGRFVEDVRALPTMLTSTAAVAAGDFTGDGRLDLFVGGRLVPRNYPYPTRSYVLRNDGGRFTDVTRDVAPELIEPGGMITDAVWVDFNGDGRLDLVTAGVWMPVQFYESDGERLRNVTMSTGLPPMRGWWYSLASGDFNGDGRPDLVAGNLGLNHTFTTSEEGRFGVSGADFTGNGTTDIVFTQEVDGTEYPFFGRAVLGRSIYTINVGFPTYDAFSKVSVGQVFGASALERAAHYQADTFASVYLQNNGDGTFTSSALPNLAQISPIRGVLTHDVDGDGNLDMIVAGNLYHTEPNIPRADAGNGLWLRGDGAGHFTAILPVETGFLAPLDVTGLALIGTPMGTAVLVANNGDSLQVYAIRTR